MIEVVRDSRVPPQQQQRQRSTRREVVVEEVRRGASRPPPMPMGMEMEDDIVEVIEEHSPVRRSRRSSGYRNVDPGEFGGGRRDRRGVR